MTALHEVGNIESLLANSPLSTAKFWWRDVETLTGAELHAFIARMEYEGFGREARCNVEIALAEVRAAVKRGQVQQTPILKFTLPGMSMTLGEVRTLLSKLRLVRRRAVLYAVEVQMSLGEVMGLRWSKAFKQDPTEQARWILLGTPRHIRTDLVFWEYGKAGMAMPLLGLSKEYADLMPAVAWEAFVEMYANVILYDYDAENEAFRSIMGMGRI